MQNKKYVLMSIKPVYAGLIKSGEKTIELRRVAPKVKSGDILVIYESSPIKKVTSYCEIDSIVIAEPNKLWEISENTAGLTYDSFEKYYKGKLQAVGLKLSKVQMLTQPKSLSEISGNLHAPQSYRYLTEEQFQELTQMSKM